MAKMITIYRRKTWVNCIPEDILVSWIRANVPAFTEEGTIAATATDEECLKIAAARGYMFRHERRKLTVK